MPSCSIVVIHLEDFLSRQALPRGKRSVMGHSETQSFRPRTRFALEDSIPGSPVRRRGGRVAGQMDGGIALGTKENRGHDESTKGGKGKFVTPTQKACGRV